MSFTGTSVITDALLLANVESGNITEANQLRQLNKVLRAYYGHYPLDGTQSITTVSTPALTSGTAEYSLPDNVKEIDEVSYRRSATTDWVTLGQPSRLVDATPYEQMTGDPTGWYLYRPAGVHKIGLIPKPGATQAVAGYTVRVRYRYIPTDLTDDGDTIYLDQNAQNILTERLAAVYARIGSDSNAFAIATAQAEKEAPDDAMRDWDQQHAKMVISPGFYDGPSGVGPEDRRFWGL